jgi:hypothetical protein
MSSFGSQMRKRLAELRRAQQDIPAIIDEVAEVATLAAVEKAAENTPPNGGAKIVGPHLRSGDMAQSWATDSVTTPNRGKTLLANLQQYASYVNDGHRMDKHFTSHLAIEGGQLVGKPDGDGGLVVGTKTQYVPGIYMKEKAIGVYRDTVRRMLQQRVREALS